MIAYASRTGTKRNLQFLRQNNWRLMVSAKGQHRTEGFPYAIDNGAWTCYKKKIPFDPIAFQRLVDRLGHGADFVTVPDIVCGGIHSLEFSLSWMEKLKGLRLLLPVQDGMKVEDVEPHINSSVGIFIGGSDHFKESTIGEWSSLARQKNVPIHCGRVNSKRRLKLCQMHHIDSFDGSGPSRFMQHGRLMNAQLSQGILFAL